MPSINNARNKNAIRIAAGGETGTGIGNPTPPQTPITIAPTPAQDQPAGAGLPQRGMFPANLVLASDRSDSSRVFRGASMRSGTFPYQPQQIKTGPVSVQSVVSAAAVAASLALETNSIPNPNQNLLNLVSGPGVSLLANPDGSVIISGAGGDGLTHGTLPWESDPGYIILRDDFHANLAATGISGSATPTGIGQLGWFLLGTAGTQIGVIGGVPPYIGQWAWSNSGTVSQAGWLTLSGSGGFSNTDYSQLGWAMFENPGWVMSFVFKLDLGNPQSSGINPFTSAQKSIYIGLSGQAINLSASGPYSRPDVFIGLRYDTSTSAPSINDSFFTLEVVANPTYSPDSRNNTQGTTLVTNVAPAAGVWHRLDIICNSAGMVTLVLDGNAANTLTTAVPIFSITGPMAADGSNGGARVTWTVTSSSGGPPALPQSVWNTGSQLTIVGFGQPIFDGTFPLTSSGEDIVSFNAGLTSFLSSNATATVSGFPSVIPVFMMGNDDTSSPTANDIAVYIDFFSFVWNPNLGPTAPGTPVATLPRYF